MNTRPLTHRRGRSSRSRRYTTRMLNGRRPPSPTLPAAARALSAYIRLHTRILDAPDAAALLKNSFFPKFYAHLLRAFYHLPPPKLPPRTRAKTKIGKVSEKKR